MMKHYKLITSLFFFLLVLITTLSPSIRAQGTTLNFIEAYYNVTGLAWTCSVSVSPDNNHVYATGLTGDAVVVFSRNVVTGQLTYVETLQDGVGGVDGLDGAKSVSVSPDNNHVYVTGSDDNAVAVFNRNTVTGQLTYVEMHRDGYDGVEGLYGAHSVSISPDSNHVYVAGGRDDAVAVFSRDTATGQLTFVEMLEDGVDGVEGLYGVSSVTVSPDDNHVYVASFLDDAVAVFSRDTATGQLTFEQAHRDGVDGVDGLRRAISVAVSPDNNHVYVAGRYDNAIAVFGRDTVTGQLTFEQVLRDGVDGVDGLGGVRSVSISPDNNHVYTTGSADYTVGLFSRNTDTGQLTFEQVLRDGVDGVDGLAGAESVSISPDNNHIYVASYIDNAVAAFAIIISATEIAVLGNNTEIVTSDVSPSLTDDTDFGSLAVGSTPITHTFIISNSGTADLILSGTPAVSLTTTSAFTITQPISTTIGAGEVTTFTITFNPPGSAGFTDMVSIANNDSDENPYTFIISGTGTVPEMAVLGNDVTITAGDTSSDTADYTDFGNLIVGDIPVIHTFTISNSGIADLTLSGSPVVTLTTINAFTVTQPISTTIGAGEITTFTITFNPKNAGSFTDTVSIANDDSDENPYTFVISGTRITAGSGVYLPLIIKN